jgi:hypothetical protein
MRSVLVALVAVGATLLPAAAQAASLTTDRACYATPQQRPDTVTLRASGLPASTPYTVSLDGKPLAGSASTDAAGAMTGTLPAPRLEDAATRRRHVVTVQAGDVSVSSTFSVARLSADFSPGSGDPRKMRVRFRVSGFGLLGEAAPRVYVHYVSPKGRHRTTVALGPADGPCGELKRSALKRLFPFKPSLGLWRLQVDTSRAYRRGTAGSPFLFYTVGVRVRSR